MRRSWTYSTVLIVVLAAVVQAQRAPSTGVRTLANVRELHDLLISPASDAVFNAATDPPTDAKGWTAARGQEIGRAHV